MLSFELVYANLKISMQILKQVSIRNINNIYI